MPDYYRPTALVRHKRTKHTNIRGLIASNGRSSPQVIVSKSLPKTGSKARDHFLEALWDWLIEYNYLVDVTLVSRSRGTISAISKHLHGNAETARRDQIKRTQAQMQGWHVVEMSYQEVFDEAAIAFKLDQLTIYLSR